MMAQQQHSKDTLSRSTLLERIQALDASLHAKSYVGFVVGDQCVGQIHSDLINNILLSCHYDGMPCFERNKDNNTIVLTASDWTAGMDAATQVLIDKHIISKRHGDLYPVVDSLCVVDRNAAPYFGVTSVGVHLNCFVRHKTDDGRDVVSLWMAQRAPSKSQFPRRWDPTVAGGKPWNLSFQENLEKEAAEEAGISPSMTQKATAVSCLSQMTSKSDGTCLKQSLYYCWDLEVDSHFEPKAVDGEVSQFQLWDPTVLIDEVQNGDRLRPAMRLVVTDFLFRHGIITPDMEPDYTRIQSAMHQERLVLGKPLTR